MQVALIIEALALEFTLDVSSLAFLSGASGKKKPNIEVKDPPSSGGIRLLLADQELIRITGANYPN